MISTAIVPKDPQGRQDWMRLVSQQVAKAANMNEQELQMFATVSEHLGLDVWRKEIYAIRYGQNNPISFVISIDGYLRKAAETGLFDGTDTLLYCGPDEQWKELWLSEQPPVAAKATVYRKGSSHGITYIAHYRSARRESPLWKSQPDIQLGINALKHALRRGFGDAFGELDKQLTTLRSEGVRVVDEDTGEILDALPQPGQPKTHAQEMAEAGLSEIRNAKERVDDKRAERVASQVTPSQPRKETSGTVGDLSTRFWTIAKSRGTAFCEPILKQFGTSEFALLDEDEQAKVVQLLEEAANGKLVS